MKMIKKSIFLSIIVIKYIVNDSAPVITIKQGTLKGRISNNNEYYEYLGIPYGAVNITNRFQAPFPPPSWDGVLNAQEHQGSCPHNFIDASPLVFGKEDCLKINVYVPGRGEKPFPVMVFVHGGAFVTGSSSKVMYDPRYLMKHEVIVVTFTYRLGVLGFLCLGIKEAPGNAGLKDQLAALRWVKQNIASFGGDTENVTVFGESAGSMSISFLMASELTDGLFHRVILQSGSSFSNRAINRKPIQSASLLAKLLGHKTEDPLELYEIFRNTSYKKLVEIKVRNPKGLYLDSDYIYLPCIERHIPEVESIVTNLTYNILTSGKVKNISMMIGFNDKEGMFLLGRENEEDLKLRNERYLFASDLEFPSEDEARKTAKVVQKFYFGDQPITMEGILTICDIYSHLYYQIPHLLEINEILSKTNSKVYNYFFKYSGGRNIMKFVSGYKNIPGASHADELFYLFNALVPWPVSSKDQLVIDRMTAMWTNFAKFGNPTPESEKLIKWEPSTKENWKFLYIDDNFHMGPLPNKEAYTLWKNIYARYRRRKWNYFE